MRSAVLLSLLALVLLLPAGLRAEETVSQQFNTLSAKVTKIDKATHTLTLVNDRNESHEIQVDPARVKNFDNIKVGDMVVVREEQRIALSLDKNIKGEKPTQGAAMTAETAAPGEKPGIAAEKTETLLAEIVGIDKANMMVSLKGPKGNIVNVLAKDPKKLEGLKAGDKVWATYTKAMAISVEPAPTKKN